MIHIILEDLSERTDKKKESHVAIYDIFPPN